MEKFKEMIDTYIDNYDLYENGKQEFECEYGDLIFYKNKNNDYLTLFGIYIYPEYRRNGYCRYIFNYLIEKAASRFKYISVECVVSKILYNYLLRFKYNNKKFKLTVNGFVYKM